MRVLVVNAGSSSLKLGVVGPGDEVLAGCELPAPRSSLDERQVAEAVAGLGDFDAVGHRIVHGGERFTSPVRVDDAVVAALRDLADLAPLHQAKSLAALEAVSRAAPGAPAVACFDTAFHAGLPAAAATYALPAAWRERWGLRRFGFHGLSHAHASGRAAQMLGRPSEDLRLVTCHLGAGASLAAVAGGRSVDTTMGFTPLEGLVMASRSGSVDPGLLLWLLERHAMAPARMAQALEHDSGLLALAGTGDMARIVEAAAAGEEPARLALDVYVHRLRSGIGAMAAALGGIDAIVFTGGVGERAPAVRLAAVSGLGFLGLAVDAARNEAARPDADVAAPGSAPVLVVRAREDLEIAGATRAVLAT